VQKYIFFKS